MNPVEHLLVRSTHPGCDADLCEELKATVAALEAFNRNVTHDLKVPLAGIRSLARVAADALRRDDAARAQQMLALIAEQAERSSRMVSALFRLAHVGQAALNMEDVRLDRLVPDVIDEMAALSSPQDGPMPSIEVHPRLPVLCADETLMRTTLINLIGNAVKFTRERKNPRIEVGGHGGRFEAMVFVRDNGVGFDASAEEDIFSPFVRLHSSAYDGHGVGLSIARSAVQRHGGRIWAESASGAGACFYFALPAVERANAAA